MSSFGKNISRFKTAARRIANGDDTVWADIKNFASVRAEKVVKRRTSQVKQIANAGMANYKVSRYKAPAYGIAALVDLEYYHSQAEQNFETEAEALDHYREHGSQKGYTTHRLFDPVFYLKQVDGLPENMTPLDHFWKIGGAEGLSPSAYFDTAFYLKKYHWTARHNSLGHYLSDGVKDFHAPFALFDTSFYVETAMQSAMQDRSPIEHYIMTDMDDRLNPHPLVDLDYIHSQIQALQPHLADKLRYGDDALLAYRFQGNELELSPHELLEYSFYNLALEGLDDQQDDIKDAKLEYKNQLEFYLSPEAPNCNPSVHFSAHQYKYKYPDIGDMNPLYHYARYGMSEQRVSYSSMNSAMNRDMRRQLVHEPTLLAPHQNVGDIFVATMPRRNEPGLGIMHELLEQCVGFEPDIIYCLPQFFRGGAEKYGSKLVNALALEAKDKKILVVQTDGDNDASLEWYPRSENVKYAKLSSKESLDQRSNVLARFIILMQPEAVINNNSHACWEAYERFGVSLCVKTRLYATMFCYDYDVNGVPVGYARDYVRHTVDFVDTYLIDNNSFAQAVQDDFGIDPAEASKFQVLHQPFELDQPLAKVKEFWPSLQRTSESMRILWPSRFHKQKRPDRLREIALALPEVEFVVWSTNEWSKKLAGGSKPANVTVTTETSTFTEMAQRDMSAILLCSEWEGLPTVLIESVVAGLPIVANDVGGVSDIVNTKTGYLVGEHAKADAYVSAILDLIEKPDMATKKREAAFAHVQKQHSAVKYNKRLEDLGVISGGKK